MKNQKIDSPAAAVSRPPCEPNELVTAFVQMILERSMSDPRAYDWTIQGFGMLRLYLPNDMRLNIWNSKYRVPHVSEIHTHPWNFESYIERGKLANIRYERLTEGETTHEHALLRPGPGGGVMQYFGTATLAAFNPEFYCAGEMYTQKAHEIHMSRPGDGCVTINKRERVGADEALTFWPRGESWVSAEPKRATVEEIVNFCEAAIARNPLAQGAGQRAAAGNKGESVGGGTGNR